MVKTILFSVAITLSIIGILLLLFLRRCKKCGKWEVVEKDDTCNCCIRKEEMEALKEAACPNCGNPLKKTSFNSTLVGLKCSVCDNMILKSDAFESYIRRIRR